MQKQQLLAFAVRAEGSTLDLDVYEAIGESYWGESLSAKTVLGKIRDAKATQINVRINSGGGDLFDGIAIYNLLRASRAKINVTVDGVAASAASVIAIAADVGSLTIAEGAFLMIHEARCGVYGTADELAGYADLVRKANATMADLYAKAALKRGVPVNSETFAKLMAAETWLTGEEAITLGLADTVSEAPALAAAIDLSAFRKTPTQLLARATTPMTPTAQTIAPAVAQQPQITVPTAAPTTGESMDLKTMQAAIEARDTELAALKTGHAKTIEALNTVTDENSAVKAENVGQAKTIEAQKVEIAALKVDNAANAYLKVENAALKTQTEALASERDRALADVAARDAKALDAEIDALIPDVLDLAERDNFVALAKVSRSLFDSMIAQRKPRGLTTKLVDTDLPAAEGNAAVGADAKFDELVSKDLA